MCLMNLCVFGSGYWSVALCVPVYLQQPSLPRFYVCVLRPVSCSLCVALYVLHLMSFSLHLAPCVLLIVLCLAPCVLMQIMVYDEDICRRSMDALMFIHGIFLNRQGTYIAELNIIYDEMYEKGITQGAPSWNGFEKVLGADPSKENKRFLRWLLRK